MSTLTAEPAPARILVVDDDLAILRTIGRYLRDYAVDVADSVETARHQLTQASYDLLLLDLRLPDGLADAVIGDVRRRRSSVPIIVMSGDLDPQLLSRGAQGGADDFIEKPFVREALLVKIERQLTAYRLRSQAAQQRAEIDRLHAQHERELDVACTIFDRMSARGDFDPATVRKLVLPADRLAGDFVFGARTIAGTYRWMIGDITGHTLSSALVTLTLAGLFYGPGRELRAIGRVIAAMERELVAALPANMFCVAAICELDRTTGTLDVWNGGSPDILIRSAAGAILAVPANSPPLAAERFGPPGHTVVRHHVAPGDRIIAFSDGLVELGGADHLRALVAADPVHDAYDRLVACIPTQRPPGGYDDDISLIEVLV
jgi:two-component system, HptB-dependent secretion and biofilm response regulator